MTEIANLTPHPVVVHMPDGTIRTLVARVQEIREDAMSVDGIPVSRVVFGQVSGLPNPAEGPPLSEEDLSWQVLTGSSDYDQDHRGWWGASSIYAGLSQETAYSIAVDLIDQVADHMAQVYA